MIEIELMAGLFWLLSFLPQYFTNAKLGCAMAVVSFKFFSYPENLGFKSSILYHSYIVENSV